MFSKVDLRFVFATFAILLVSSAIGGCAQPRIQVDTGFKEPCECSDDIDQVLAILTGRQANYQPIQAKGKLVYTEYDGDKKKREKFEPVNLKFYPPNHLFFRANYIGGEFMRLGQNDRQFWVRIKPEASSYWWGENSLDILCDQQFSLISPRNLIDALGVVNVYSGMTLSNAGGFNVLTSKSGAKKVYIDCCDYKVKRIEYFQSNGSVVATVELGDFATPGEGTYVPTKIDIAYYDQGEVVSQVRLNLKNVRLFKVTPDTLSGKLFQRPSTKGFENIYKLNTDCVFVRE